MTDYRAKYGNKTILSESAEGRRIETVYNTLLIDVCCLETADNSSGGGGGGGDGRNYSEVVYQYVPRHEAADAAADADRMHDMASLTDPSSSWTIPPVKQTCTQTDRQRCKQTGRQIGGRQPARIYGSTYRFRTVTHAQHCKTLDVRTAVFWRFSPCK